MNYEIKGEPFPVVICNLNSGESVKCQAGAMAWMSPNMDMKTQTGGLGKMFGKALTGRRKDNHRTEEIIPCFIHINRNADSRSEEVRCRITRR